MYIYMYIYMYISMFSPEQLSRVVLIEKIKRIFEILNTTSKEKATRVESLAQHYTLNRLQKKHCIYTCTCIYIYF